MGIFNNKKEDAAFDADELLMENEELQAAEEEAEQAEKAKNELANAFADEMGIITPDTKINGSIVTKGHLAIAGFVDGSVKAAGNIMLSGVVTGNIECNNIIIDGLHDEYNNIIKAKGSVSIKEGASILGSITCKHVSVMGVVNGNIKATGNVGLTKTSAVKGDISAAVLAVEPGAKLQGCVMVK